MDVLWYNQVLWVFFRKRESWTNLKNGKSLRDKQIRGERDAINYQCITEASSTVLDMKPPYRQ